MKETDERKKRKSRRGWIILAAVLALLLLVVSMLFLIDGRYVRFYMYGDEEQTIEYGTAFQDPGVYAVTTGRLFGESEERLEVETFGAVDTGRLGSYVLRYVTHYAFSEYSTERKITVVDTTPPVIELKHIEGYEPTWMTGYAEEGFTATDNCDGDLTGKVKRTPETDRIIYTVADTSGNSTTVERELPKLSYQPPTITLLGERNLSVPAGLSYTDPGFEAYDSLGNDVSAYVVVEDGVVPYLSGDYEVWYSSRGGDDEIITEKRYVSVLPAELPKGVMPQEKTIYLTFDDGPGPYTAQLLDILKSYNVKATFFVTSQQPKYLDLIGRAFREGHSIGVHTSCHDYDKIYASEQAYFDDFFAMEEIVRQQTGDYTRLFRFPGGSSNTVSSFNPGIMSRLTRAMTDMGYQYYDWNVVSGDAGGTNKTKQIIENIETGCQEQTVSMILQHDIKDYSVAAVETVIQWGLANGYSFKALTLESPAMHHGVNN